jgi:hypothetical protein
VKLLRRFWHRLRASLTGARVDDEFADEIEAHLQMQTEDNLRLGMSPEAARRAAALRFGSVESAKGSWRDQRILPLLDTIPSDVRFAVRGLVKEPGFAAVCVLTLALAIGASSAIFSVVNAALIRPLAYPHADRLCKSGKQTREPINGAIGRRTPILTTGGERIECSKAWRHFDLGAFG